MGKVLVIGPNYYNFLDAVKSAFVQVGWECRVAGYDNPVDPYDTRMRILYKCGGDRLRERLQRESRERFNNHVRELFESECPESVFIINGDILTPGTMDLFRTGSKVALWLFDNVSKMPACRPVLNHCDRLYSFDRNDVRSLKDEGLPAGFLPQACDTTLYFPMQSQKDIDILFIGDLYYYPNRQSLLRRVVESFPDRKIMIAGSYKPWFKNPVKWLLRERRDVYTNRNIPSSEVNSWYNRARVVLNIHREDQKDGANPRVFEICGSGAYQICDRNPYVASVFPNGEIGLFDGADSLVKAVEEALTSDKSDMAARAHDIVMREHTYINLVSSVLRDLGL